MDWSPDSGALGGRVALVAGATRGAGRGIAAALGEAGATVICTFKIVAVRNSVRVMSLFVASTTRSVP